MRFRSGDLTVARAIGEASDAQVSMNLLGRASRLSVHVAVSQAPKMRRSGGEGALTDNPYLRTFSSSDAYSVEECRPLEVEAF